MEAKQQKQGQLVLGVAAVLFLGFFIYQYTTANRYDWRITLEEKSKEPYGTYVIKDIMEHSIAKDSFHVLDKKVSVSLPESTDGNSNFVFIGEALLLDSTDVDHLTDFVNAGNTVFISSLTIPDLLMDQVYYSPCDTFYWEDYGIFYDTAVITNFVHPNLKADKNFSFPYVSQNIIQNNYWQKIESHVFCEEENYPIIINQGPDSMVTMAKFPYGAGAFYLQTTPIVFTNYHLTKKTGQEYTQKAFAHLKDGPIYWDNFSNVPAKIGRDRNWADNSPLEPKDGPLDYVLSQPPLAWAWYSLLSLGLLYLLFRAKRRQRMIPVLAENRNTSLEFISTIGRLHFTGQNHKRIALQKMDLLQSFIRSKYKLSIKASETDFTQKLSAASEIDESLIEKMFLIYKNIKSSEFTTDKTLIELHKLTHYFYKNCR